MDEYRVLNVLMILFSSQIVNTYLHAFHNTKKKNYLKWEYPKVCVNLQTDVR